MPRYCLNLKVGKEWFPSTTSSDLNLLVSSCRDSAGVGWPVMLDKEYSYNCFGKTYPVFLRPGYYSNGRFALELVNRSGECEAKVTVNLPEVELERGEILVKTWMENEPMADFLIENGIATDTGKRVDTGFTEAWIMKLSDKVAKY